jgi:hypothetical protein
LTHDIATTMTARSAAPSPAVLMRARAAALLTVLLIPVAVFGMLYVPSTLIVPGDAGATVRNVLASESLFRLGIVSTLLSHLGSDVFWPLVLYQLLKPVNKTMAVLMVIFSFLGFPISMLNELNQLAVLAVLHGADAQVAFTPDQLRALVSFFVSLHADGIRIATIFWGLWLFPYGYLVFKSGFLPRAFGILLMVGCFGYLIQSFAELLWPGLEASIGLLPLLGSLGELLTPLWLLLKGVNVERWEQRARASA